MKIAILITFILLSANSVFAEDSGIFGPSADAIRADHEDLAQRFPEFIKLIDYGVEPQTNRKLYGLLFNKSKSPKQLSIITGATHGNEYLNIVDRLSEYFANNRDGGVGKYLDNDGAILIVPIFNMYGYVERNRRNDRGVDLNRDYPLKDGTGGLKQVETRSFVKWVGDYLNKNNTKLAFTIDYHCCYTKGRAMGAMMYPESFTSFPNHKQNQYLAIKKMMQASLPGSSAGTWTEMINYQAKGVSDEFWATNFGSISVTYEGEIYEEDKKFDGHANWMEGIFYLLSSH